MTIEAVVIGGDEVEMGRRWIGVGPYSQQPNNIFFLLVNLRVQRVKNWPPVLCCLLLVVFHEAA
jgi:cell division protein FtsW (lipid II flippase)